MRITTIGFGYVKSLGNYENCKVYLEAQLEPGEDSEESMADLRNRVAEELDLPDQWHDLKGKFARQLAALEKINEKLQQAERRWEAYACFLAAHGVSPASLTIGSLEDLDEEDLDEDEEFLYEQYSIDQADDTSHH